MAVVGGCIVLERNRSIHLVALSATRLEKCLSGSIIPVHLNNWVARLASLSYYADTVSNDIRVLRAQRSTLLERQP